MSYKIKPGHCRKCGKMIRRRKTTAAEDQINGGENCFYDESINELNQQALFNANMEQNPDYCTCDE